MKKALFLIILASLAASSYAQPVLNRDIFIEGSAPDSAMIEYFYVNFIQEAVGAGYTVAIHRKDAGFIFRFDVTENPYKETDGNQYDLKISLFNNLDKKAPEQEILSFHFYFDNTYQMYEHNQFLFNRAASVIPPLDEDAVLQNHTAWKNKWIYFRASFDYPITFYQLMPMVGTRYELYGPGETKIAVYDDKTPPNYSPLDHKIIVLPGFTIGAEFHFLDFMSLELNFRGFFGGFSSNYFLNLAAGAQLKFPIKIFRPFVISPYIGGMYFLRPSSFLSSDEFYSEIEGNQYPPFAFGGGIQLNTRGGRSGAFFIDANYMFTLSNHLAGRNNPFINSFPNPSVIKYRPYYVYIGIGYKFGIKDRPEKSDRYIEYRVIVAPAAESKKDTAPDTENVLDTDSTLNPEPELNPEPTLNVEPALDTEPERPAPPPARPARRRQTFYF